MAQATPKRQFSKNGSPLLGKSGSSKQLKEPQIGKLDLSTFAPNHSRQFEENSARAVVNH